MSSVKGMTPARPVRRAGTKRGSRATAAASQAGLSPLIISAPVTLPSAPTMKRSYKRPSTAPFCTSAGTSSSLLIFCRMAAVPPPSGSSDSWSRWCVACASAHNFWRSESGSGWRGGAGAPAVSSSSRLPARPNSRQNRVIVMLQISAGPSDSAVPAAAQPHSAAATRNVLACASTMSMMRSE